jgi:anti-anti-sigma regulatory factor
MGITQKQNEDSSSIWLDGAIDSACAMDLKVAFLEAFNRGKKIRISLEETTDLDITAFQLLWAAEREATRLGLDFALEGELPEKARSGLAIVGLDGLGIFLKSARD